MQSAVSSDFVDHYSDGISIRMQSGSCGLERCILEISDANTRASVPHEYNY
jgi:hypothetical protein